MTAGEDSVAPPSEVTEVVGRYHRLERTASGTLALLAGGLVAAAVRWLPLLGAAVASLVVLAVVRVPVFRSHGAARLATEVDPETVHDDITGLTPLVLATRWGVADEVRRTDEEVIYDVSYPFGLRSTSLAVETCQPSSDEDGTQDDGDLEIVVSASDRPWATYVASGGEQDGRTVADVGFASDRRYGLRRLPQWLLARRYRGDALAAQGYAVVERDVGLTF